MKTKMIISAAFWMLFATSAIAHSPNKILTLKDSFGRNLSMPVVMEEEVEEDLPFDLETLFHEVRLEDVSDTIDISKMVKPEAEVEDVPSEVFNYQK